MEKGKQKINYYLKLLFLPAIFLLSLYRNLMAGYNQPRCIQLVPYVFGTIILTGIILLELFFDTEKRKNLNIVITNRWCIISIICAIDIHIVMLVEWVFKVKNIYQLIDFIVYDAILICIFVIYYSGEKIIIKKSFTLLAYVLIPFALYGWLPYMHGRIVRITAGIADNPQPAGMIFLMAFLFPLEIKNVKIKSTIRVLFFLTAFFSLERSVWVGLFIVLGLYILLYDRNFIAKYMKYIVIALITVFLLFLFISPIRKLINDRLSLKTVKARMIPWEFCLNYYEKEYSLNEKIFGKGFDTGEELVNNANLFQETVGAYAKSIDNQFITVLMEFGIIGVIMLLLWFIIGYIVAIYKNGIIRNLGIIVLSMLGPFMFYDTLIRRQCAVILVAISGILLAEICKNGIKSHVELF